MMAFFTDMIMDIDTTDRYARIDKQCYGLVNALYLMFGLHIVNGITCLICLTSLDKYICSSLLMVLFMVSNITVLAWA